MQNCDTRKPLHYDLYPAASGFLFRYNDLFLYFFFQFRHMGDNAYQALSLRKAREGPTGLGKGLLIQGAKSLIHKHGVQSNSPRGGLHFIRKSKG